jgi:hypothetical protein
MFYFLWSSMCVIYKICTRYDIAEILLMLALSTNQLINLELLNALVIFSFP